MKRKATFIVHTYEFKRGTFPGGECEIRLAGNPDNYNKAKADCSLDAIFLNMTMQLRVDTKEEDFQTIIPAVMYKDDPMMIKEFPRVKHKHFRVTIEEIDDDEVPA